MKHFSEVQKTKNSCGCYIQRSLKPWPQSSSLQGKLETSFNVSNQLSSTFTRHKLQRKGCKSEKDKGTTKTKVGKQELSERELEEKTASRSSNKVFRNSKMI